MTPHTRRRWLVAMLLSMAIAAAVTPAVVRFSGLKRSTWVRVVLDAGAAGPPALRVAYAPGHTLPVIWEDAAAATVLGLKASAPVRLLSIDTDRGAVPPWLVQTWGTNWERVDGPLGLLVRQNGIIDVGGSFRRFTLTFAPAQASVDVGWLDQHRTFTLSAATLEPQSVTLTVPMQHRGWVLLPPTPIDRIAIRSEPPVGSFVLREVTVHGTPRQAFRSRFGSGTSSSATTGACAVTPAVDGSRISASSGPCEVVVEGLRPINQVSWVIVLSIWVLVAIGGLLGLWTVAVVAARVNRAGASYELVESAFGRWTRQRTNHWSLPRVAAGVSAVVLCYHLTYALAVPAHFNFDSLGYYAFGRNLLFTHSLDAIGTCRTPGYPAAIASSVLLFGDQVTALVVLQHLALAMLGPGVVWFLYPRAGPLWSGFGGLLAGTSPIMSLTANMIWTEPFFVVFATAALLIFLRKAEVCARDLAAAGILAGIATLIRPNGIVIVAIMLAWIFLRWWCDPSVGLAKLVRPTSVVVGGFALMMSPWLIHFHRVTGHWGVSDANCAQEGQSHTAVGSDLRTTNIFQLAGFVNLISQSDVGSLAVAEPYKAFFNFFPARHRYYVERFLPWELTYDDRLPGELFREYLRVLPVTYLRQVRDALVFNLTHLKSPQMSIFVYPDLEDLLKFQRTRPYPIVPRPDARASALLQSRWLSWPDADILLTTMTSGWAPQRSAVRSLHLRVTQAAMSAWPGTMMLALLGALASLVLPGYRRGIVLAWHSLVLAVAPAVLAMGADRYAMVAEPTLYVLIAILFATTLDSRLRRRPTMMPRGFQDPTAT